MTRRQELAAMIQQIATQLHWFEATNRPNEAFAQAEHLGNALIEYESALKEELDEQPNDDSERPDHA
jgi:hypothetical protein